MTQAGTAASSITICTLWEHDLHKGVGTLVNSLVEAGYRGNVWAGYRGEMPPWAKNGVNEGVIYTMSATADIKVILVRLDVARHFAHYKGTWMIRVLSELEPGAEGIYYFDPDIFVLAKWSFFESWVKYGVALCEDSHFPLNGRHPIVCAWQEFAAGLGYRRWNPIDIYVNSGLVGVSRGRLSFVGLWQELIDAVRRDFDVGDHLRKGDRTHPFYIPDQDALALAACLSEVPISLVGVDGMAFDRGMWLTLHAYLRKPWRQRIWRDLLSGFRPDAGCRLYWRYAQGPIQVEPTWRVRMHRWMVPIAAGLGRFYSR